MSSARKMSRKPGKHIVYRVFRVGKKNDRLLLYGGPDGEMSASMRYLAQRYSMPVKRVGGLLTDIGTEAPEMFRSRAGTFLPGVQGIRRKQTACRCLCSRVAPLHRQKLQIYINVVLIYNHHFI